MTLRVTDIRYSVDGATTRVVIGFAADRRRGFLRIAPDRFEVALMAIADPFKLEVFCLRFGLGHHVRGDAALAGVDHTYAELGVLYGISRARAHQIVDEASAEFIAALGGVPSTPPR